MIKEALSILPRLSWLQQNQLRFPRRQVVVSVHFDEENRPYVGGTESFEAGLLAEKGLELVLDYYPTENGRLEKRNGGCRGFYFAGVCMVPVSRISRRRKWVWKHPINNTMAA